MNYRAVTSTRALALCVIDSKLRYDVIEILDCYEIEKEKSNI